MNRGTASKSRDSNLNLQTDFNIETKYNVF